MKKNYKYQRALKEKKIRDNIPIYEVWMLGNSNAMIEKEYTYTQYKNRK